MTTREEKMFQEIRKTFNSKQARGFNSWRNSNHGDQVDASIWIDAMDKWVTRNKTTLLDGVKTIGE